MGGLDTALAERLRALILQDAERVAVIEAAETVANEQRLPEALLAAGFLRNCVWDALHQLEPTPCNDVDLIYFDPVRLRPEDDQLLEQRLSAQLPTTKWEVKNQARMSRRHGDPSYSSAADAMRFWPEQQTAVAMTLDGSREVFSPFGLAGLFAGNIAVGPHRPISLMKRRAQQKNWFDRWPKLKYSES